MPDLSDSLNWSETDANNNQPPPNGWPEGMFPSGVNDAARADRGALKRFWDKINPIQSITPSGGLYAFTTDNLSYPANYVAGEIYRFTPVNASVGGDFFQINGLSPKPIWKHAAPHQAGFTPIVAFDILGSSAPELVYDPALNGGTGAFILVNPFIPMNGDGTGYGAVVSGASGNLIINRNAAAPPLLPNLPSIPLQIVGNDGEAPALLVDAFNGFPAVRLARANGSGRTPSLVRAGDNLGHIAWSGYASTGWLTASSRIDSYSLEDFGGLGQGSAVEITATPVGQTVPQTQAVFGPGLTVGTPAAVPGGIQIGDVNCSRLFAASFSAGSMSISGGTAFGNITATGLTVSGNAAITGALNTGPITASAATITGAEIVQGDLQVHGYIVEQGASPSIAMYNTTSGYAAGIWVNGSNLEMGQTDTVGNPSEVLGYFDGVGGALHLTFGVFTPTINGTPVTALETLPTQVEALTARVATLEAAIEDLRRQVSAHG